MLWPKHCLIKESTFILFHRLLPWWNTKIKYPDLWERAAGFFCTFCKKYIKEIFSFFFKSFVFSMIYFESSINVDLVLNVPSGYYPAPFHYFLRASTQIQIMWTGWHNFSSMQKKHILRFLWQNKLGTGGGGWGHLSPSKTGKKIPQTLFAGFPKLCQPAFE